MLKLPNPGESGLEKLARGREACNYEPRTPQKALYDHRASERSIPTHKEFTLICRHVM